ncbi:MAG: membrane protein of unknown function [Promethearchaeota archaeon]|jgi:hypothetical protein|nr:MAG: membrane protein of unknown function [Candidatus Lokiarchaeota archaeon]
MSFIKGFGIGLVVFVALNFVFTLIVAAASGIIDLFFSGLTDLGSIFSLLFGPIATEPYTNILGLWSSGGAGSIAGILTYTFNIVSPLIAAIIAGRLAGGKRFAALAWFLIAILTAGLLLIPEFLNLTSTSLLAIGGVIFLTFIPGVINGVFYATFGMLVSESEFY